MAIYTVLVPGSPEPESDPMAAVFVKEGFSWPALVFALPWLVFRRLWLALAGYVAAALIIIALGRWLGDGFTAAALILLRFLLALEANELRRWTLERKGYRLTAVVEGRGVEEAEIRYFAERAGAAGTDAPAGPTPPAAGPAPPPAPPAPPPLGPIPPSAEAGDVIGLFPAPGARA